MIRPTSTRLLTMGWWWWWPTASHNARIQTQACLPTALRYSYLTKPTYTVWLLYHYSIVRTGGSLNTGKGLSRALPLVFLSAVMPCWCPANQNSSVKLKKALFFISWPCHCSNKASLQLLFTIFDNYDFVCLSILFRGKQISNLKCKMDNLSQYPTIFLNFAFHITHFHFTIVNHKGHHRFRTGHNFFCLKSLWRNYKMHQLQTKVWKSILNITIGNIKKQRKSSYRFEISRRC